MFDAKLACVAGVGPPGIKKPKMGTVEENQRRDAFVTSQRILLMGGLSLFLCSIGYGFYYDGFVLTTQHNSLSYNLDMAINMAVKGDIAMASSFAGRFGVENQARAILARIPLHFALAGAMTTVPLWLAPRLETSERLKRILAFLLIGGGFLLPLGDYLQVATSATGLGLYFVMGGYAWLAMGVGGYLLYAVLYVWLQEGDPGGRRQNKC